MSGHLGVEVYYLKTKNTKTLVVDIGCGDRKVPDAIGIDTRCVPGVDILADARYLPLKTESVDFVYSNHLLEHFGHGEVKSVLREWVRVLKQNRTLEISCPDLRIRALLLFLFPSWKNIRNIYGEQDYEGNYHKCGFSYQLLKGLLEASGITRVSRIIDGYQGIPFIPSCLRIRGKKR